jgi:predicted TIM-barrel fold metal-dependent hydrolase
MASLPMTAKNAGGPRYAGPIFDADTHVYETDAAFDEYFPADLKAQWGISQRFGPDGKFAIYVGDRKVETSADHTYPDNRVPAPGKLHEWLRSVKEGKANIDISVPMTRDMQYPVERIAKLDEWEVASSLIYCGQLVSVMSYLSDPHVSDRVLEGYNRWLLDTWSFDYQGRIFACPVVTLDNLDHACAQARWFAQNGARAIVMPMGPTNGKAPAYTDHDPFWSIINDAGIRVVYHIGEAIYMRDHMAVWGEPMQQPRMHQSAFVWHHGFSERPMVETLSSLIYWNFFERFPNIKVLSAENGAEWVPALLTKMDKVRGIARMGHWPGGPLKERPSRIFQRHVGVVAYPEDDLVDLIGQTGNSDWILMGSDYPHAEGTQTPRDFADIACNGICAEDTRKVMYENGMRFMGLAI